jgi:copper chaperone CopZ
MAKTTLKIEGMMCEGCVGKVKKGLEGLDGVSEVTVDLKKGTATVTHEGVSDEDMISAVVDAGFRASVKKGLFS